MSVEAILEQIDEEIRSLTSARAVLAGGSGLGPRLVTGRTKRFVSASARRFLSSSARRSRRSLTSLKICADC